MRGQWVPFQDGATIGQRGSENGEIIRDDEYVDGARITLEQGVGIAAFAITCGVYGWMAHTRFFGERAEADTAFDMMKQELEAIVAMTPMLSDGDAKEKSEKVTDAIVEFIARFP